MKDLRKKVDVFNRSDEIMIKRIRNKQGKTRVSVFQTRYCDEQGFEARAYTPTI